MDLPTVEMTIRTNKGKGPARRLRGRGLVPSVLYGNAIQPILLTVSPKTLGKALSGPLHTNTVMKLQISDEQRKKTDEYTAMVCDHQYDPVSRKLLHVDFLKIDMKKEIEVEVPIEREGRSVGEQLGGVLSVTFRTLPVRCLPTSIPELIKVDVTDLKIGGHITVGELETPEGIEVMMAPETTIVSLQTSKRDAEETKEEDEGEGEGEEGETAPTEEQKTS